MKRGTPHHPKTLALAALLGVDRCTAVGLLEGLWHFAGAYARRGDVGRLSDSAIAAGLGTTIDGAVLVKALLECGWLDGCECHRLRIHDWPHHADQAVQKTNEVKARGFLECYSSGGPPEKYSGPPETVDTRRAEVNPPPAQGTGHRADGTGNGADGGLAAPVTDQERQDYGHEIWRAFCVKAGYPETRHPSGNDSYTLQKWVKAGVPLRVVLGAIKEAKGSGYTLAYYSAAVKDRHDRWRQALQVAQ